jgi:hypothetical protein
LENNPQLDLLDLLEKFYQKPNKNAWEKWIAQNGGIDYINYLRSMVYIVKGDLQKANAAAQKAAKYDKEMYLPNTLFGYNRIECFDCDDAEIMGLDYLTDFSFISAKMGLKSLTEALLKLQKTGEGTGILASKANYLLGNFFYNVSFTGYYGNISHFSTRQHHYFGDWFSPKTDIFNDIYFKYYPSYYENPADIAQRYLEKSYQQATADELKARIVFALSKCEQEKYYEIPTSWTDNDNVLIKGRKYFAELMKYKQTKFFKEVKTNCKYFEYYVNNYAR